MTSRNFKEKEILQVADFIDQGFKLAIEINKAASGPLLKDFLAKMNSDEYKAKLKELRENVENFAVNFPMPGLDEY